MSLIQFFIVGFALLTFNLWQFAITGYWMLPKILFPAKDIFGDAHYARLSRIKQRVKSTWTIPLCLTVLALALTPWWRWDAIDTYNLLRPIILVASGIVTWRAISMDLDLATGTSYPGCRVLIVLAWIGVWFHPGFLILVLHTGITWLRSYYHHQHLAIRIMFMFLACLGALPIISVVDLLLNTVTQYEFTTPTLFLFLCLCASHYFIPAIKKLSLGPHWYSWMLDNRLHSIAISSYLWGWVRFLPEDRVIRFVRFVRRFDRPFQIVTLTLQFSSIFILFDQSLCIALIVMFTTFNLTVAVLSGIFFWQWMVMNVLLVWAVWNLPPDVAAQLFGFQNGLVAAAILILLPLRGKVWSPVRLGWWDTPFPCRVNYEVKGRSGTWYGLYNDFMCPNERIFGQEYGAFLSDEKRINAHVGEAHKREQFDALRAVGEDLSKLEQAKQEIGSSRYDPKLEAVHDRYITAFIRNFNAGHRKRMIPAWLKAPGGQLFYWGTLPRFTGQEPIDELVVHYREHYFDGQRVVRVTDRVVKKFGASELHGADELGEPQPVS